jgi:hypothetical protein
LNRAELLGQWKIRRHAPPKITKHESHPVAQILHLSLYRRESGKVKTLAKLTPIRFVQIKKGAMPDVLPIDRAKTWEELISWIKHFVIFPDPAVQEGQYQNRLLWENWAHSAGERPKEDALYDWQRDEPALVKLRPRYLHLAARLAELVGQPKRSDFDLLYPNEYDDEGLSDPARQAMRDLRILFGAEIIKK